MSFSKKSAAAFDIFVAITAWLLETLTLMTALFFMVPFVVAGFLFELAYGAFKDGRRLVNIIFHYIHLSTKRNKGVN